MWRKEAYDSNSEDGGKHHVFSRGNMESVLSLLVLPFFRKIIDVVLASNAVIIPVAIEQYENRFITKIGRNFDAVCYGEVRKAEALLELRNQMAE